MGRLFGVWDDLWNLERRATFLIDREGTIRYVAVDSRALDGRGVLEALAKIGGAQR